MSITVSIYRMYIYRMSIYRVYRPWLYTVSCFQTFRFPYRTIEGPDVLDKLVFLPSTMYHVTGGVAEETISVPHTIFKVSFIYLACVISLYTTPYTLSDSIWTDILWTLYLTVSWSIIRLAKSLTKRHKPSVSLTNTIYPPLNLTDVGDISRGTVNEQSLIEWQFI